ncbi:MAG: hypothetical protein DBX40_04790 [Clostridiales bacterium]|nr:MAG: hypothetical protein DBX40_04790 [Clostridiales bacterium]
MQASCRLQRAFSHRIHRSGSPGSYLRPPLHGRFLPNSRIDPFGNAQARPLYYAGVDVLTAQRYLGHANAQTTIDIYTHFNEEKAHKDADKLRNYFK